MKLVAALLALAALLTGCKPVSALPDPSITVQIPGQ